MVFSLNFCIDWLWGTKRSESHSNMQGEIILNRGLSLLWTGKASWKFTLDVKLGMNESDFTFSIVLKSRDLLLVSMNLWELVAFEMDVIYTGKNKKIKKKSSSNQTITWYFPLIDFSILYYQHYMIHFWYCLMFLILNQYVGTMMTVGFLMVYLCRR